MPASEAYGSIFETFFRAVRTNLATITTANSYATNVALVGEEDYDFRNESITGPVVKITDLSEDFSYRPAQEVESNLIYSVEGWLPGQVAGTLRANLRAFVADFMKAHHDDVYLVAADLANGGAGERLVKEHRVIRVEREYGTPWGYFRAEVRGVLCFNTGAS